MCKTIKSVDNVAWSLGYCAAGFPELSLRRSPIERHCHDEAYDENAD